MSCKKCSPLAAIKIHQELKKCIPKGWILNKEVTLICMACEEEFCFEGVD